MFKGVNNTFIIIIKLFNCFLFTLFTMHTTQGVSWNFINTHLYKTFTFHPVYEFVYYTIVQESFYFPSFFLFFFVLHLILKRRNKRKYSLDQNPYKINVLTSSYFSSMKRIKDFITKTDQHNIIYPSMK